MFRTKSEGEWRTIGTEDKPEFVYLNREDIKVGGITFKLENVSSSIKHEKVKINEEDEKVEIGCSLEIEKERLTLVFGNAEDEKQFRKRGKKFIKKL